MIFFITQSPNTKKIILPIFSALIFLFSSLTLFSNDFKIGKSPIEGALFFLEGKSTTEKYPGTIFVVEFPEKVVKRVLPKKFDKTCGNFDVLFKNGRYKMIFASLKNGDFDLYEAEGKDFPLSPNFLLGYKNLNEEDPRISHGKSEKIVFKRNDNIYLYDLLEKIVKQLTKSEEEDWAPSISKLGDKIVFTRGNDQKSEIFLYDIKTGELKQITKNNNADWYPTFIDEDSFYFVSKRWSLCLMDILGGFFSDKVFVYKNGKVNGPLVVGADPSPVYNMNSYLVYTKLDRKYEIHLYSINDKKDFKLIFERNRDLVGPVMIAFKKKKDIIAYYPLNGNVKDYSGNKYNGKNYGAIFSEDRKGNLNGAVLFNGKSYVEIPSNAINGLKRGTVSLWFLLKKLNRRQMLLDKTKTYRVNALQLMITKSNKLHISIGAYYGEKWGYYSNTVFKKHIWYHIALTWDGNYWKLYVNGEPDIVIGDNRTVPSENIKIYLGKGDKNVNDPYSPDYLFGKIDELKVFKRCLGQEEIEELFFQEK